MKWAMLKRKFKDFIINPKFQWTFIFLTSGLACLNLISVFGAVQWTFKKFRSSGLESGIPEGSYFFTLLNQQHHTMNWVFGIVGALNFMVILIAGIMISHRIAGPLFRLCRHMDEISSRVHKKELSFRKSDFFLEIPPKFNKLVQQAPSDQESPRKSG